MAVAHDNHATAPFAAVATISTTLTVAATSNRGLLALLAFNNATIPSGLTCTWDAGGTNQSMTAVSGATAGQTAGNGGSASSVIIYGLIAPTSGTSLTFTASWTGNFTGRIGVVSFTGVAQESVAIVFNNGASNSDSSAGGSTPATVTITTSSGEAVCAVMADNGAALSTAPSDSVIWGVGPGLTIDSGANYFLSTGGPHALTCAWGGSADWAIAGTNIKQFTTPETTAGMRVFDLSPSYSARPLQLQQRTWVGRGLRSITYPVVTADAVFDLPPSKLVPFRPDATFSDRTHILLRGQDKMTAAFRKGTKQYDLSPRQVPFRPDATFVNPLEIALIGQDKMTAAFRKESFDQLPPKQVPFRPDATFSDRTHILLRGQDKMTAAFRKEVYDLPPLPSYQIDLRSWFESPQITAPVVVVDTLPARIGVADPPPPVNWFWDWAVNLQETTLATAVVDTLPARIGVAEPPTAYPPLEQTWWPYPNTLNLIDNVAFDAKTSIGFSVASTVSTSFLNVGTNNDRALICGLVFNSATIPSNITATWDTGGTPQPLTAIVGASASQTDAQGTGVTTSSVILYGLVAPHMGTLTFTASWTGTFTGRCVLASYYGVDQSGGQVSFPNGSGNSDSSAGGSNPATITVATAFGNAIMAVTADNGSGGVPPLMSDTVLFSGIISATYEYGADYYLSLGVLKTLTGTWAGASDWCMAATDIKASSSAAALLPIKRQFIDLPPPLPRPRRAWQLDTWEKSYPRVLIGQDKLPAGDQTFALTAPRDFQNSLRTWLESYQPGSIMPPNAQEDWPNPLGSKQPYAVALRTWVESPQITPTALPTGEQISDRPAPIIWYRDWAFNAQQFYPLPAVVTYPLTTFANYDWPLSGRPPPQVPSWAWWYNLDLIGQDKLPTGEQFSERPSPINWYRSWELNLQETTLPPPPVTTRNLAGSQSYDRPPPPIYPGLTWLFSYDLNLIGKDKMIVGEQVTDRPSPVNWYRDWELNLQETTLGPAVVVTTMPARIGVAEPIPGYSRLEQTWTFSYKLNLIGKDKMIVGEQVTDRPPPVNWYRDWRVNLQQTPFTVTVIPTMPARVGVAEPPVGFPPQTPSWALNLQVSTLNFVLNPVGASVYRLVPPPVNWYRDWAQNLTRNISAVTFMPSAVTDTSNPLPYPRLNQTWAFNLQQTPFVRYPMPARIGTMDPPLPPQRLDPTWSYSYNLSRIGKDLMLAGEQVYDLTKRYAPLVPSWTWSFPIELTGIGPILGLLAYNRPALRVPSAPSWTWSFNLNLIGIGPPLGREFYNRTQRTEPLVPSWQWPFNFNLVGLGQPPTGVASFATPAQRSRMPELTNWNWSYNLRLIGKDRRLTGQQSYDLARGRPIPLLQTWAYNAPAFRIPPTFRIVYTNYDWPLPQRPPRLQQQSFFSNTTPYMPAPTPVVIPTLGDLVLIANQELRFFGEHDTYSSRITQIYLILPNPVEGYPEMTFERPDGSTFRAQFPYVSVGQFTANTNKGLAIAGHYLVYNVVKTQFYYPGVWRAFAKGDGEGASFYVRTY